jgi:hypothetical protein
MKKLKSDWLQQSLIFGGILGVLWAVYNLVFNLTPAAGQGNNAFIKIMPMVIMPLVLSLAGFISGWRNRSTRAGTFTGLCAALLAMLISALSLYILMTAFLGPVRENTYIINKQLLNFPTQDIDRIVITSAISGALLATTIAILEGAILGTIGGFIGMWTRPQSAR